MIRAGLLGEKFLEESLLWGGQDIVGMNNSTFVGEVVEVVELVVGVVQGAAQGVHVVDNGIEGGG